MALGGAGFQARSNGFARACSTAATSRTLSLRLAGNLPLSQGSQRGWPDRAAGRAAASRWFPVNAREVLVEPGTASRDQDIALYASYAATGMGMGSGGSQGEIAGR